MIGQLGKYVEHENGRSPGYTSRLNGSDILQEAISVIAKINKLVPVTNVILECDKEHTKVQQIYEQYGFRALQEENSLIMYLLKTI